jgi:hypothetical protein
LCFPSLPPVGWLLTGRRPLVGAVGY